jgi:hypothetical protein
MVRHEEGCMTDMAHYGVEGVAVGERPEGY